MARRKSVSSQSMAVSAMVRTVSALQSKDKSAGLYTYKSAKHPQYVFAFAHDTANCPNAARWSFDEVSEFLTPLKSGKFQEQYQYWGIKQTAKREPKVTAPVTETVDSTSAGIA